MLLRTGLKQDLSEHSMRLEQRGKHQKSLLRSSSFFVQGLARRDVFSRPSLAIVGTRKPTAYGICFLRELVSEIRHSGWNIISGGALGIDLEAHAGALKYGLATQAWVVGPISKPSPRCHAPLFKILRERRDCALLVPEHLELSPNQKWASKGFWPERNHWIAASSDAVVIVEAGIKSGTWSTVKAAQDFGVPVYALPGPINSPQSEGTNSMIANGYAHPITSVGILVKSLVVELGWNSYNDKRSPNLGPLRDPMGDSSETTRIIERIRTRLDKEAGLELCRVDVLAKQLGLALADLLKALDAMSKSGELQKSGDRFERRGKFYES